MKTTIKLSIAFFLITITSCRKESIQSHAALAQSSDIAIEKTFQIGDSKGGGIIFYLDSTKMHGLIAAKSDQGISTPWYNGIYLTTGASGKNIGTGASNTSKIVKKQGSSGNYAALICANYTGGGFTDWFLPSKDELDQLYKHRDKIGGLDATNYWSSTEFELDVNNAYDQEFSSGYKFRDDKSFTIHVRAVRSF